MPMSDLHAVAHAAWDAQWVRETPPTREEALAAVADAVARAVAEEIAAAIEAAPAHAALPYGVPRMDRGAAARIARETGGGWLTREAERARMRQADIPARARPVVIRRIGGSHG